MSDIGITRANSAVHPEGMGVCVVVVVAVVAVGGLSAGKPARFPGHPLQTTWDEEKEKSEGARKKERGKKGESFPKQNTKTWGHKSVREAFRSHAGSWAREKPNCPLWHKSHSVGTGCCLRDVPDPSALHCSVCDSMRVHACLAQCWLLEKDWRREDLALFSVKHLTVNERFIDKLN